MAIAIVTGNRYTVDPLYQWDSNQVLEIRGLSLPSVPEIHFSNNAMEFALVRPVSMDSAGIIRADIPNTLLQKPYMITAHVCMYQGDTFASLYKIEIPVKARTKPNDYTFEDTDGTIYSFNALENMVRNGVEDAKQVSAEYVADAENRLSAKVDEAESRILDKFGVPGGGGFAKLNNDGLIPSTQFCLSKYDLKVTTNSSLVGTLSAETTCMQVGRITHLDACITLTPTNNQGSITFSIEDLPAPRVVRVYESVLWGYSVSSDDNITTNMLRCIFETDSTTGKFKLKCTTLSGIGTIMVANKQCTIHIHGSYINTDVWWNS